MVTRKSRQEIDKMRRAGRIVAEVLALVESELKPGVSTGHLDRIAERYIREAGAVPSFKGYHGYPSSLCISIDDEVVHGIPGERVIHEGQVVSIDAGAIYQGWHGDGARTFVIGATPARGDPSRGHDACRDDGRHRRGPCPGIASATSPRRSRTSRRPAGTESSASTSATASARPCTRSRRSPTSDRAVKGMQLVPGICLAIEPMLTLGSHEVETRPDGWTVVTRDGSLAAHFEHTIAITEQGPQILTTV